MTDIDHKMIARLLVLTLGIAALPACSHMQSKPNPSFAAARSFVTAGEHAVHELSRGQYQDDLLYDLASLQAMIGDVKKAQATAKLCSSDNKRASTYCYIAEIQTGFGDSRGARGTLLLAKESALQGLASGQGDTWLTSVAMAQARSGDVTAAENTLLSIKSQDSLEICRVTLTHFLPTQEALKVLDRIKGPCRRDLALGNIVDKQAALGNVTYAVQLAEEIGDLSRRADAYLAIAEAHTNNEDTMGANTAYAQARKYAAQDNGDHFREIVNHQLQEHDISGALVTAGLSSNAVSHPSILIDIAMAQSEDGKHEDALLTLKRATALSVNKRRSSWHMAELSEALAILGSTTQALATVSIMKEQGDTKAGAYEDIVDVLLAKNQIKESKDIAGLISDPRWRATALASIGLREALLDDLNASRRTFAEARELASTVSASNRASWTYVRSTIYNRIAGKQAQAGDYEEIKRWVPLLENPRDRASSWLGAACWPARSHYYSQRRPTNEPPLRMRSSYSP